jgi:hypothetical protein
MVDKQPPSGPPVGEYLELTDGLTPATDDLTVTDNPTQIHVPGHNWLQIYKRSMKRQSQERDAEREREAAQIEAHWALPQPFDPDFSLKQYEESPEYEPNRELDRRDREASRQRAEAEEETGPVGSAHTKTRPASHSALPEIGPVAIGERQAKFYASLKSAEAVTGVPVSLAGAMWCNESRFGTLGASPSGCQGDAQFCRGTWAAVIKQYGDKIPGMEKYAAGLRDGSIKIDDAGLQAMRKDAVASAYGMDFYIAQIGKDIKIDPKDPKNARVFYAAYTVGPGNARKMVDADAANDNRAAATMFPKEAGWNPMFFAKGQASSSQALNTYESVMDRSLKAFNQQIVAKLDTAPSVTLAATTPVKSQPLHAAPSLS